MPHQLPVVNTPEHTILRRQRAGNIQMKLRLNVLVYVAGMGLALPALAQHIGVAPHDPFTPIPPGWGRGPNGWGLGPGGMRPPPGSLVNPRPDGPGGPPPGGGPWGGPGGWPGGPPPGGWGQMMPPIYVLPPPVYVTPSPYGAPPPGTTPFFMTPPPVAPVAPVAPSA